ncbi:MAG: hypothetical protein WDM96_04185 [Lacunisphaera sp.]
MTSPSPVSDGPFARWLPRVLVLLLALYFSRVILPITPVEGDEQGVVEGVRVWVRGTRDFEPASYAYPIQPGSYHVIWWLHRLTDADPLPIFGVLTALSAAIFVLLASLLAARAAAIRPAWVAVALLSAQEITAAAAYANTSALAAVPLMGGLLIAQRARTLPPLWLAGVLLGLAGWLRLDSLLISPVVLALRWSHGTPGQAVKETVHAATASVLALVAAFFIVGASFPEAWAAFTARGNFSDWSVLRINGWLVLGYTASAISLFSLVWLFFRRQWATLALVIAAGAGPFLIYGGSFASPKYFHAATPFFLLPVLVLLREFLAPAGPAPQVRRGLAGLFIGLHVTEALVGVQTSSAEFRRFDPAPPLAPLATIPFGSKLAHLGLGEGEILQTADGPRMRGGQAWAPAMWRREKAAMREEITRLDNLLQTGDIAVVVTSTYLGLRLTETWLRGHGFTAEAPVYFPGNLGSHRTQWHGPGRALTVVQVNHTSADAAVIHGEQGAPGRLLFVNDRGGAAFRHLAAATPGWQLLSPSDNRLLTLYLRAER